MRMGKMNLRLLLIIWINYDYGKMSGEDTRQEVGSFGFHKAIDKEGQSKIKHTNRH
jgi:hypothetical protein